jgi:hypothetical protein
MLGKQSEHLKNGHREHPIRREIREVLPVGINKGENDQWAPGDRREASSASERHTCKANRQALGNKVCYCYIFRYTIVLLETQFGMHPIKTVVICPTILYSGV